MRQLSKCRPMIVFNATSGSEQMAGPAFSQRYFALLNPGKWDVPVQRRSVAGSGRSLSQIENSLPNSRSIPILMVGKFLARIPVAAVFRAGILELGLTAEQRTATLAGVVPIVGSNLSAEPSGLGAVYCERILKQLLPLRFVGLRLSAMRYESACELEPH